MALLPGRCVVAVVALAISLPALLPAGCASSGTSARPDDGSADTPGAGSGGSGTGGAGSGGAGMPPATSPSAPAVGRGATYGNAPERFNRYYTDRDWKPTKTIYVDAQPGASGDGSTRATPTTPAKGLAAATAGTQVTFLRGDYPATCYEFSGRGGTYDQPIVLFAERNPDGTRAVKLNCCGTGRQTCINLEAADYVAIDGFELAGGRYGVRAVGGGFAASEHSRGIAVLNCDGHDQNNDPFFSGQSDWDVWERNLAHGAGTGDGHGIYLSNGSDWNIVRFNEIFDNASSDFQINADPELGCTGDGIPVTDPRCDGVAGSGDGGRGVSDFFLVEGNFFHHGRAQGANFTSVRNSVVRNNIFAIYARHGVSFWQETDNPKLGSSDNLVLHNLFVASNRNQMIQFIKNSTRNQVRNNLFVGVTIAGGAVAANTGAVAMEVDNTVVANIYDGNYYISTGLSGRSVGANETARPDFDPTWFTRFPAALGRDPADFAPAPSAPFLNRGKLLPEASVDRAGIARTAPTDIGPFEKL